MITLKRFMETQSKQWEACIGNSNNGTLFHRRKFLNYHPKDRFEDHSLMAYKKDKLLSVFPAAVKIENSKRFLVSHPGASMGSFVVPVNLSIADAMELGKILVKYTREQSFDGIRITLSPSLYQSRISNYMDFSFFKQGFTYAKRDITSVLFLENNIENNLQKFRSSHRRAVRKAQESGVVVRRSEDYAAFYNILVQNLSIRHHVAPTHTLKELLEIKNRFPEDVNLFGAYLNNEMLAGAVNFIINEHVVLAFYISHQEKYQEYRSVNLLFYSIFNWAISKGLKIYDFGTFTVDEEPNMGLGRFKENFGASGVFRDTVELNLT